MKVANYANAAIDLNVRLFGTDGNGIQKNYPFSEVLGVNNSIDIVKDSTLSIYSISEANTYFIDVIGGILEIVLPSPSADIDTYKYVIMSTENIATILWSTDGALTVGLPSELEANKPICIQYSNSSPSWFISM